MGGVESQESGRTLGRRRALGGEGCPLRIPFQSFASLVNVSGRGPTAPEEVAPLHCAWHLCQPFRALQKLAQEIV